MIKFTQNLAGRQCHQKVVKKPCMQEGPRVEKCLIAIQKLWDKKLTYKRGIPG